MQNIVSTAQHTDEPSRLSILLAFAAVYIIWGSTYLAIRFAIATIPPFLMAGVRFLTSGIILYLWSRLRGAPAPTPRHWSSAATVGLLLLMVGNGGVTWAEQTVPSGITALLAGTVPVWVVLLDWIWHGGQRPGPRVIAGLLLGILGAATLSGPGLFSGGSSVNPLGAIALFIAAIAWSVGSLYSRKAVLPQSPLLSTGMEMLTGGAALCLLGTLAGEWSGFRLADVSMKSALSLGYLIAFGSLIGFSSYLWLLRVVPPARASTYAYVNPVIALFLGWALASEPLTPLALLASAITIAGVALIVSAGARRT